jgi:hypothetical protein
VGGGGGDLARKEMVWLAAYLTGALVMIIISYSSLIETTRFALRWDCHVCNIPSLAVETEKKYASSFSKINSPLST